MTTSTRCSHPIIASVSGGKDSTALCFWLQEQGFEYRAVHMDTGWEHPETDRYLREVLPEFIGPIEWITPPRTMAELIRWKACFPGKTAKGAGPGRFCTEQLKVMPLMVWLDEQYPDQCLFNAMGIRADESQARANLPEFERGEWAISWRPLLARTVEDVIAIHKRHDCPPNPLYLQGCSRVGCWPCIFASKAEIRLVADTDPGRIDELRRLEAEVSAAATARYAARGETFASLGYTEPTYFATKQHVNGKRKNVCTPIDEVVKWSRTSYGGKQYELFHEPDRSGCMRWGLCDS